MHCKTIIYIVIHSDNFIRYLMKYFDPLYMPRHESK